MHSSGNLATAVPHGPVRHSRMAIAAVLLSVLGFLPPFGIAAVVLGYLSSRRIDASRGLLNGKAAARAAMIIACVQMLLVAAAVGFGWRLLHRTIQDFRHDAMVERVFREADANRQLDYTSAREEEITARALVFQMQAIEEQYYRRSERYLCSVGELIGTGVEGTTPAEKLAFGERVHQSAYNFELWGCDSAATHYKLAAVPRTPRMPEGCPIYCADHTGMVRQKRGGTSADCLDHGSIMLPSATPSDENPPVRPLIRPRLP
jgi:hypothetical protein